MATENIEALEEMRRRTVERRRRLVKDLAAPQEHGGGAQDLREMFIKVQATLEAIDRALEDERAATDSVDTTKSRSG